jgi:catechol 2,3-dioxygenase-like lactoylglutathione lyase family enzyme
MFPGDVRTLTPVLYVTDLDAAGAFYGRLGFEQVREGGDDVWAWKYVRCGELTLLLARGGDQLPGAAGPVQIYCQSKDVTELQGRLTAAGSPVEQMGFPAHAPGGEIRISDPDGHVLMIAQTDGAPPVATNSEPDTRKTVLERAAEIARKEGVAAGHDCRVGNAGGVRCRNHAEVKLADTWGDGVWSCLEHAEEVLLAVNGAFIADREREGLSGYLARRRSAHA